MNLGNRLAVIADVHGQQRVLQTVLRRCQESGVSGLVLLGDLFDRLDQAEACAACFQGWPVAGVVGNHEREALSQRGTSSEHAHHLLCRLTDQLQIENATFVHDGLDWKPDSVRATVRGTSGRAEVTFAGHTHVRQARDDNGPLDLALGRITLRPNRRYLVNPGAAVEGQFAIWDRANAEVIFERI